MVPYADTAADGSNWCYSKTNEDNVGRVHDDEDNKRRVAINDCEAISADKSKPFFILSFHSVVFVFVFVFVDVMVCVNYVCMFIELLLV